MPKDTVKEKMLDAEQAIIKAFEAADNIIDAGALWWVISRSVDKIAQHRIKNIGSNTDDVLQTLDECSLTEPI